MHSLSQHTKKLLILGTLSGMRANAGVLLTNFLLRRQPGLYFSPSKLVKLLSSRNTTIALTASAIGETVMDKLPGTPDRIEPAGLAGRTIAGAICGATVNEAKGSNALAGACVAGAAAIASSFAFYYLRKAIGKKTGVPDLYVGAAEDILALAIGYSLYKNDQA